MFRRTMLLVVIGLLSLPVSAQETRLWECFIVGEDTWYERDQYGLWIHLTADISTAAGKYGHVHYYVWIDGRWVEATMTYQQVFGGMRRYSWRMRISPSAEGGTHLLVHVRENVDTTKLNHKTCEYRAGDDLPLQEWQTVP